MGHTIIKTKIKVNNKLIGYIDARGSGLVRDASDPRPTKSCYNIYNSMYKNEESEGFGGNLEFEQHLGHGLVLTSESPMSIRLRRDVGWIYHTLVED